MAYPTVRVWIDFSSGAFDLGHSWTEVTSYVFGMDMAYGRSSLLDEFQPGRGSLTLNNNDGSFDPTNPGAIVGLAPRNRIKVEATISEVAYTDTFGDGTIDTAQWSLVGSGGTAETGGSLVLTSATSATTRGVQSLEVTPFYDLIVTASTVVMSATPWPTSAFFYPVYLRMDAGDTEACWWEMTNGTLIASYKQPGVGTDVYSVTHNNTTHAHLRIRRTGHSTVWESSTDGSSWTTRASQEIAWQEADTCVLRTVVKTTGAEGTTDTMSISSLSAAYSATHSLAYGWVSGWPQSQQHRSVGQVQLEWSDALTLLARTDMPASVYDYRVAALNPRGWYKLADGLPVVEDSSGWDDHGTWGVFEEQESPHHGLENRPLPKSILKAGAADSVIPMSGRDGMNWAKLQAEVGQPLGGTTDTWRTPVARLGWGSQVAGSPSGEWSFEMWVVLRQAFPLDITNTVGGSLFPISQPLLVLGEQPFGATSYANFWRLYIDFNGYVIFVATNTSGGADSMLSLAPLNDVNPHHIVVTSDGTDLFLYVDGSLKNTMTPSASFPLPVYRAMVGYAHNDSANPGDEYSLQSTLGDVVVYWDELSGTEILELYRAGMYGSLDGTARLTAGQVIDQALDMIGWGPSTVIDLNGHYVAPSIPDRAPALGYIRKAVASERGVFWQAPNGQLIFLTSNWTTQLGRAKAAHWLLSDDGSTLLSYSQLDFGYDDESIINEATVSWADGEQQAEDAASVATFGRLRESVDTILDSPEDALQLANWLTAAYAQPRRVVSRPLVIEPTTTQDFSFVCAVQFGSRITCTRTTADGRTVSDDYWVQAVRHRIAEGQGPWTTELTLEPADHPGRLFTLDSTGTSDGSDLDSDDVLAF